MIIYISIQSSLTYRDLTYPDTCLGTKPHSSTESGSLIRKFSCLDSQSANEGVRISEVQLYIYIWILCVFMCTWICVLFPVGESFFTKVLLCVQKKGSVTSMFPYITVHMFILLTYFVSFLWGIETCCNYN